MKQMRIFILPILCILLWACNDDDTLSGSSNVAVEFGMGNIAVSRTVVTNGQTEWSAGDPIGIFMITHGATNIAGNIEQTANNIEYQAQTGNAATSGFTSAGSRIHYPHRGDVDFIAYYPYQTPLIDYKYAINVNNQNAPSEIDILYSNNATGYNKTSGTVDLQFTHVLSKLNFSLISGTGSPDLTGAQVTISGIATEGKMDLNNGTVTTTNNSQTITANTAGDGQSSSAIVVPQYITNAKLTITLTNGDKFDWTINTSEWQSTKEYKYIIIVNKTGIAISTGGITNWTDTNNVTYGEAEARIYYKPGDYYPAPKATTDNDWVTWPGIKPIGIV